MIRLNIRLNQKNKMALLSHLLFFVFAHYGCFANAVNVKFSDLEPLIKSKNLHVKASEEALDSLQKRRNYFTRSLIPKLSMEVGYETFQRELFRRTSQPYGAIQAEMNIYNAGKDRLEERIREQESIIGGAEGLQLFREELLKAQTEYWQITYLSEFLQLLESYSQRNAKNLVSARRRISAGSATESDQMEFEMTKRLIEQDLAKAKTQLSNSRQKLNVLLGNEPNEPIVIVDALPKVADFNFQNKAIDSQTLPEVTVAQSASEIAALKRSQGVRWWIPKMDAYTGYKQMNMRESDEFLAADRQEYYLGVKFLFNIFDGGEFFAESRSQAALARSLENKAKQSLRELSVEFENSKAELKQLSEQVSAASKDVEMSERFLGRILSEYSRGVKSSSEVLSASDRSFEFQKRFAELRRDYQISRAKFFSLLSKEEK